MNTTSQITGILQQHLLIEKTLPTEESISDISLLEEQLKAFQC